MINNIPDKLPNIFTKKEIHHILNVYNAVYSFFIDCYNDHSISEEDFFKFYSIYVVASDKLRYILKFL